MHPDTCDGAINRARHGRRGTGGASGFMAPPRAAGQRRAAHPLWFSSCGHTSWDMRSSALTCGPNARVQQTPQGSSKPRRTAAHGGHQAACHGVCIFNIFNIYLQHAANLISIVPQAQQTSPSPQDEKGEQREAASQQRYAYMSAWPQRLPALHLPCSSHKRLQH